MESPVSTQTIIWSDLSLLTYLFLQFLLFTRAVMCVRLAHPNIFNSGFTASTVPFE